MRTVARQYTRRFVLAGASAAGMTAAMPRDVRAAGQEPSANLVVETRQIEVMHRSATVYGIRDDRGYQGLKAVVGEDFVARVENRIASPCLLHWHGLTGPWRQDSTSGFPQAPLAPGRARDVHFPLSRSGTHWIHSHTDFQAQGLLAAPFVVDDPSDARLDEQQVVMMLHDFSFRSADETFTNLRQAPAREVPVLQDRPGEGRLGAKQATMGGFNDVDHDAYLANDRTLDHPEIVQVEPGGRIRLRIINGAATTNFTIDLGRLHGRLIAVDGNPVHSIFHRRFPIAMGQRLDIRLRLPKEQGSFPILALREAAGERTGIILSPAGATIAAIGSFGTEAGPSIDAGFERSLAALAPLADRAPDRTLLTVLTGGGLGYDWTMTGPAGLGSQTVVRSGERVHIIIRNETAIAQPIHLHGHHFQIIKINRMRFAGAVRDTVLVPPVGSVTIAFDAVNPGRWPFHCHHLYRMASGMITEMTYADLR